MCACLQRLILGVAMRTRVLPVVALVLLLLSGTGSLAAGSGARISGHLWSTRFTVSQGGSVRLTYSFSKPSTRFGYLISFATGPKWRRVVSVTKTGNFKGSHTTTIKRLFAGKTLTIGGYRLRLFADGGSTLLSFRVTKAGSPTAKAPAYTALPTISGTATQGQTLSASDGSWSNFPTSYALQWRRCNSTSFLPWALSRAAPRQLPSGCW
jgi:hypothetical protein